MSLTYESEQGAGERPAAAADTTSGWSTAVDAPLSTGFSIPAAGSGGRRVCDVMMHRFPFVTREATIGTAVELLRTHSLQALPVVEDDQVIGILDILALTRYSSDATVEEALGEAPLTVDAEMALAHAARLMRTRKLRQVAVTSCGKVVGLLSDRELLRVWGAVNDSLTGLPLQDQLRDWTAFNLTADTDVAILFLDLNGFGRLNKQRGQVYGDDVLKHVAEVLVKTVDPQKDFVSRCGGDEFAVATVRRPDEAQELAVRLRDGIAGIALDGQPANVSVAIGIAGGRRARLRPDMHLDATLDDLITRASRASSAAKEASDSIRYYEAPFTPATGSPPEGTPGRASEAGRVVVDGYQITPSGEALRVSVALRSGRERHERSQVVAQADLKRAVALATAECLQIFAGPGALIRVEETYEYATPSGMECVGATVALVREGRAELLVGTVRVREDLLRSYIHVVLDAANRRLGGR